MTALTALIVLLGVYVVAFFALLALVIHAAGVWWGVSLVPVEIVGGYAFGTLIGRVGDLS
jgi:hypothetical protein